jgi:hypothetical protein
MKYTLLLACCLFLTPLFSQSKIVPTEGITITGQVKKTLNIGIAELKQYPVQKIKPVQVTNHKGEVKGALKNLKGIPIIEILKNIEIDIDSPKLYSECYLIFEASDGYKVVYSWNELFNSDTGKNTFIVTQKDDKTLETMEERIMLITPKDYQTGRRYVKCLKQITVKRI